MPLHHQSEPHAPRYDHDTVRQAAVLASRLQQEQKETLSQEEAEALGAELGIDPRYMSRALEVVSQRRAARTVVTVPTVVHGRRTRLLPLVLAGTGAVLLLGMLGTARWAVAPAMALPPPVEAIPVISALPVSNGDFQIRGRAGLPSDWALKNGSAKLVRDESGNQALQLGDATRIEQVIPTSTGSRYTVRFRYRGAPSAERAGHFARIEVGHTWGPFSGVSGPTVDPDWQDYTFQFRATDSVSTLRFETRQELGPGGMQIDDVTVTPSGN